jgi:hypothetical protein
LSVRIAYPRRNQRQSDFIPSQTLSRVFDINFTLTFLYIQQRQIIEKIINALPDTDDIRKIQKHLKDYLEKKIPL